MISWFDPMSYKKNTALIALIVFLCPLFSFFSFASNDFMDVIFQPSKNLDHVIDIGNNKNAVGNEVFRWKTTFIIGQWFVTEAPLLVRITQTLLRLTIALSVPVIIFVGVKIIKNSVSGGSIKDSIKELSGILLWLALALSAMGIIYLIQSLAIRSLSGVI